MPSAPGRGSCTTCSSRPPGKRRRRCRRGGTRPPTRRRRRSSSGFCGRESELADVVGGSRITFPRECFHDSFFTCHSNRPSYTFGGEGGRPRARVAPLIRSPGNASRMSRARPCPPFESHLVGGFPRLLRPLSFRPGKEPPSLKRASV